MIKTFRIAIVAMLVVLTAAFASRAEENKLPADVLAILNKADSIELLSLDPTPDREGKDTFHGFKILGKTTLKGAEAKKVITAIQKGIKDSDGSAAFCFMPRHGIRATVDDKTADLVICYQCQSMAAYLGDKDVGGATTTAAPKEPLNKILKDAKVPLPKN